MSELLECGHPESAHSESTRGYGKDADGRTYCYDCCQQRDQEYMQREGRVTAYLSGDGTQITGWPGFVLATVTAEWETSAGGFCRQTQITRVRARDGQGQAWYGRGLGRGMCVQLRRAKGGSK